MINKDQHKILKMMQLHNAADPVSAIDILNYPFYDGFPKQTLTDTHLKILCDMGLIKPTVPTDTYETGYGGDLILTSIGHMTINDFEYQHKTVKAANIQSWVAIGISAASFVFSVALHFF